MFGRVASHCHGGEVVAVNQGRREVVELRRSREAGRQQSVGVSVIEILEFNQKMMKKNMAKL